MVFLIGLIVIVPMSTRLVLFGRRRALPQRWLAWFPLAAPLAWLGGVIATNLNLRDAFAAVETVSPDQRVTALSEAIAEAMHWMLIAGIVAIAVLAICFAFFTLRPKAPEPEFE